LATHPGCQKVSDRILVVTPPDDTLLQGIRIVHVELTEEHSSIVSNALMQSTLPHTIINYVWRMGDSVAWLMDKIVKGDLVIFNASPENNGAIELIIGWVAAQPQSYYFGNLKDLHMVNDRAIYSVGEILTLLETVSNHHE
jgi:hypothetical protein